MLKIFNFVVFMIVYSQGLTTRNTEPFMLNLLSTIVHLAQLSAVQQPVSHRYENYSSEYPNFMPLYSN